MELLKYKRTAKGWETIRIKATPEEVRAFRAQAEQLLAERRAQAKKPCGCYRIAPHSPNVCQFHALQIGEEVYGNCFGTLTELSQAGADIVRR